MNIMKVITVLCWIVAALAIIGLAIWFLTGTIFGIKTSYWNAEGRKSGLFSGIRTGGLEVLNGPYQKVGTYEVWISEAHSLKIDWIAGEVSITPYDGESIQINEYARRELREDEKLSYSTYARTLSIKFFEKDTNWVFDDITQKRLEVLIPRALSGIMNDLEVDSTSAGVHIENINAKQFEIKSISGRVEIANAETPSFSVKTTSGSIHVDTVKSEEITIESTSGSVHVSDCAAGEFKCETTSGSIDISGDFGEAKLHSTSGSLSANGAFSEAKLHSTSGRVKLENSASASTLSADTLSGSIELAGSFTDADVKSTSGRVSVSSRIIPSSLKVETTSGSIQIYVPNEGAITVRHSSTSGSFSSDVPVTMQSSNAQFRLSSTSGSVRIYELR